jgi:hypothetical protein
MSRAPTRSAGAPTAQPAAAPNPEVAAFLSTVLLQIDHAADLVIAFFRSLGMADGKGDVSVDLPQEFLLELGALLQLLEWQDAGVIESDGIDGTPIDTILADTIADFSEAPGAFVGTRRGIRAMMGLLQRWNENCSPVARRYLECDIAVGWDEDSDIDALVDALVDYAWRHRHCKQHNTETNT